MEEKNNNNSTLREWLDKWVVSRIDSLEKKVEGHFTVFMKMFIEIKDDISEFKNKGIFRLVGWGMFGGLLVICLFGVIFTIVNNGK